MKRSNDQQRALRYVHWQKTFFTVTPKQAAKRTKELVNAALDYANLD